MLLVLNKQRDGFTVSVSLVLLCPFYLPSLEISRQFTHASSNCCRESEGMHALYTMQHVLAALLTSERIESDRGFSDVDPH